MRILRAAWLAVEEAVSAPVLQRIPEPTAEMHASENVSAFHDQGGTHGALLPIYHFNATYIHRLTPRHGTVVDLGCGSGRFLAYLARCRPDLNLIGIDLSPEMISVGNDMLRKSDLNERVTLLVGDMTSCRRNLPLDVATISSIFSLHHLPTVTLLDQCLQEIAHIREERGTAVWIFDHARPNRQKTAERFPMVFTPNASPAFQEDSSNSLMASWRYEELRQAIGAAINGGLEGSIARVLPLYQVHWTQSLKGNRTLGEWQAVNSSAKREATRLAALFDNLPRPSKKKPGA